MKKIIFILLILINISTTLTMEQGNMSLFNENEFLYNVTKVKVEEYDKIFREQIQIPYEEQKLLYDICESYSVNYYEALSIYMVENESFNQELKHLNKNGTYDWGDFQINDINHKELIELGYIEKSSDLLIRKNNFNSAIFLISKLNKYSGHKKYMAYNMGIGGMKKAISDGITSTIYSKKAMTNYKKLKGR
ncbi:MAG: hypothetical protein PHY47_12840 [Lachnospiraceae bacterium]|nr:hypothetical protein [Lachnospiraceae bacterium]